ncbi:MAG: hypothetical protein JNJ73_11115 [Hyphomonadaceae bacterium]|nr:hypothetical protein [Hyphomonadaceae bacterium]
MFALLILFVGLAVALFATLARRALPFVVSAAFGWLAHRTIGNWVAVITVAAAVYVLTRLALDWLADPRWARPFGLTSEAAAAGLVGSLAAFAVFGSAGMEEAALIVTVIASALAATAISLRFRLAR